MSEIGESYSEEQIEENPDIKDGQPVIRGTGVLVKRIAGWYTSGLSPEEIAADYPHLDLEQVFAALSYYQAHKQMFDEQLLAEEKLDPSSGNDNEPGVGPELAFS